MYIFYRHINSNEIEMMWIPDYLSDKIDRLLSVVIAKVSDNQILDKKSPIKKLEKEIEPWYFFYNDDRPEDSPLSMSEVRFDYVSKCDKEILKYLIEQWPTYLWNLNKFLFLRENIDRIYDYATVKDIIE